MTSGVLIKQGSSAHKLLLALRAGDLESDQMHERFNSASKDIYYLIQIGLAEKFGEHTFRITAKGKESCPNRRDIAPVPKKELVPVQVKKVFGKERVVGGGKRDQFRTNDAGLVIVSAADIFPTEPVRVTKKQIEIKPKSVPENAQIEPVVNNNLETTEMPDTSEKENKFRLPVTPLALKVTEPKDMVTLTDVAAMILLHPGIKMDKVKEHFTLANGSNKSSLNGLFRNALSRGPLSLDAEGGLHVSKKLQNKVVRLARKQKNQPGPIEDGKTGTQAILEYLEGNPKCLSTDIYAALEIKAIDCYIPGYLERKEVLKTVDGNSIRYELAPGLTAAIYRGGKHSTPSAVATAPVQSNEARPLATLLVEQSQNIVAAAEDLPNSTQATLASEGPISDQPNQDALIVGAGTTLDSEIPQFLLKTNQPVADDKQITEATATMIGRAMVIKPALYSVTEDSELPPVSGGATKPISDADIELAANLELPETYPVMPGSPGKFRAAVSSDLTLIITGKSDKPIELSPEETLQLVRFLDGVAMLWPPV